MLTFAPNDPQPIYKQLIDSLLHLGHRDVGLMNYVTAATTKSTASRPSKVGSVILSQSLSG